jgi:hypothetical protein
MMAILLLCVATMLHADWPVMALILATGAGALLHAEHAWKSRR